MLSLLLLPVSLAIVYGLVREYRELSHTAESDSDQRLLLARRQQLRFIGFFVSSFVVWGTLQATALPSWLNQLLIAILIVAGIGIVLSSGAVGRARIRRR